MQKILSYVLSIVIPIVVVAALFHVVQSTRGGDEYMTATLDISTNSSFTYAMTLMSNEIPFLDEGTQLQVLEGDDNWNTVNNAVTSADTGNGVYDLGIKFPVSTTAKTVEYQLVQHQALIFGNTVSRFTINYVDTSKATGQLKKYYKYLTGYCSGLVLKFDDAAFKKAENKDSLAYYTWNTQTVTLRSDIPASYRRYVILHECAHYHQYLTYGPHAGYYGNQEEKALKSVSAAYPASPKMALEYNADCVASVWGEKKFNYGTGHCNSKPEIDAAKDIAKFIKVS